MLKRKYIIIGFLAFCLTATLFIGITTSENGSSLPYDPWCDITEDGKITITDIVHLALRFGTTGNPTKNVTVTNWPAVMNVNVTNWQGIGNVTEAIHWVKYIGQHDLSIGPVLIPPDLGQVGLERVETLRGIGYYAFTYIYHTLGKIDVKIPKNREILAKVTLAQTGAITLKNMTMEFGYTDNKTVHTPLVSASWAGSGGMLTTPTGYTLELGSLDSDYTITGKYVYFKVFVQISVAANDRYIQYWTRSDYNDVCVLIPTYG